MIEPTTPLFQDLRCPQTDAIIIWTREPSLVFTQEHLLVHQQSSQGADWVKRHPQPAKGHRPKTGRLGSETEAMTFQFLSGWRNAAASALFDSGTLKDLCPWFTRDFTRWVDTFPSSLSSAHEVTAELDSLERSWSSTLSKIERLQPQNLAEAMAKFEVAQAYAAWSSPGEGRASALIAAASSALHEFLAPSVGGTRQSLREQIRGHRAQGHTIQLSRSVHT